MTAGREYGGLDRFRIAAALLVVAIHTGPLLSFPEMLDYAIVHVLCRVAVPFFFMATGFFLLPRYVFGRSRDWEPLGRFLSKTGLIYLGSILLYLPVNLYAGHFSGPGGAVRLFKGLFFEGTFYHLWYLPASLLGTLLVVALSRRLRPGCILLAALALYLIGLLGDSYYGVATRSTVAENFYQALFAIFGYTRNGLFFAPVFLLLGAVAARLQDKGTGRTLAVLLGLSSTLMLVEGLLLHWLLPGRHDSMYLLLPPVMLCLFLLLLRATGASSSRLRRRSLLVYLLHPMCIIGIRGTAKLLGLTWLLVEQSLVHYLAVCAASQAMAVALDRVAQYLKLPRENRDARAWAEIDLAALRHNIRLIQRALPEECRLMAVLKADAYGHGAARIAREAGKLGVRAFAVATVSEGAALRKSGVRSDILVLGYTHESQVPLLVRHRLMQTVVDAGDAERLNACGKKLRVHLKIDTGMHRLGEWYDMDGSIRHMMRLPNLEVEGLFTHLCASDSREEEGIAYTREQIRRFQACVDQLKAQGVPVPQCHIQSSYGLVSYPEAAWDYARVGIALYGMFSREEDECPALRPVLSLRARVECVHQLHKAEPAGYGLEYVAPEDMLVACIAAGYADGVPRALSGRGEVLLRGQRAKLVGRICMDRLLVDVTDIPEVRPGDTATLIGRDGQEEISACRMAGLCGTISNEILSRLGMRLPRVYRNGEAH